MMLLLSLVRDVVVVDAWRCGCCGHEGGCERVLFLLTLTRVVVEVVVVTDVWCRP